MGIVGGNRPSTYSKSPELWNEWCRLVGFPGDFRPIDIDDPRELPEFLEGVWSNPDFADLTVTNPYKQDAFRWFKAKFAQPELTVGPAAARLEAMNHFVRGPEGVPAMVTNTDGAGLLRELPEELLGSRKTLLIGAGGAARSIADALLEAGISVTIANIVDDDARALADTLTALHSGITEARIEVLPYEALAAPEGGAPPSILKHVGLVILAISEGNPLSQGALAGERGHLTLVDVRYGGHAAGYLAAREAGVRAFDGRHMLYGQFALAADILSELHGIPEPRHRRALETIKRHFLAQEGEGK